MKTKKVAKAVGFSILGLLVVVLVILGVRYKDTVKLVFNWDNISSFVNSQRYTREEIEDKMQQNKQEMEKIAQQDPNINIRGDLTEEENLALKQGKITKEEAVAIVKGDTTLNEVLSAKEEPAGKAEPPGTDKPPKTPADTKEDKPADALEPKADRASEIIAELYVVQADFISRLEALGDRAYEDYRATRCDRTQIMSIVDSYTGEVSSLEAECDGKVSDLLKELKSELTKVGGDLSTVSKIRKFYYNEKSLKKTYYLNRLNDEDYK